MEPHRLEKFVPRLIKSRTYTVAQYALDEVRAHEPYFL